MAGHVARTNKELGELYKMFDLADVNKEQAWNFLTYVSLDRIKQDQIRTFLRVKQKIEEK